MKLLLARELRAGAFGLSTGLEYEQGHFATTEEVVAPPLGIPGVMVAGEWVVEEGKVTGKHPGRVLKSTALRPTDD